MTAAEVGVGGSVGTAIMIPPAMNWVALTSATFEGLCRLLAAGLPSTHPKRST